MAFVLALLVVLIVSSVQIKKGNPQPRRPIMALKKEYRVGGRDPYIINYSQQHNGTIQMHVQRHPDDPYRGSAHQTHLLPSGNICVAAGREPRSMAQAETIAKAWMESYSNYTRTGRFE